MTAPGFTPHATPRPRLRERSRLVRWCRLWRTRRPVSFTEKVRYKLLRDRRPLMITFADKAAVREYVRDVVGEAHLPSVHHLLDDPHALTQVHLPESYVVKPTHGSGAAIVVSPAAAADARLPEPRWGWVYAHVRPEHADPYQLARIAGWWLSRLYGRGPNHEWAYGRVPRRVLVEEFLAGDDGGVPDDFKLFVFHGTCHYVQVDRGRFGRRTQDFFTPDWTRVPFGGGYPPSDPSVGRPSRLTEMVALAERLGRDTDFVRVDLYVVADRLVVGELTSAPAGGDSPFHPASHDVVVGRHWTVPPRYR